MKKATMDKIRKAQEEAYVISDGVYQMIDQANLSASRARKALTQIFGDSSIKQIERAESVSNAVFVVAGMLTAVGGTNKSYFEYLQQQRLATGDVRKWTLKQIFPSLTPQERKEVKNELECIGLVIKSNKVVAFHGAGA